MMSAWSIAIFAVGHTLSQLSIQAADAASLQGKFWEMHDLLFDQSTWSTWDAMSTTDFQTWIIKQAATISGLDVAKFTTDLTSDAVVKMVSDEKQRQQLPKSIHAFGVHPAGRQVVLGGQLIQMTL